MPEIKMLITFLACLVLANSASSQVVTETDTTIANKYYTLGDSLLLEDRYDSAIVNFKKSEYEYRRLELKEQYFKTILKISYCQFKSADYETARKSLKEVMKEIEESLGRDNLLYAKSFVTKGELMVDLGKYDSSVLFFKNALNIRKKLLKQNDPSITKIESAIGFAYSDLGKTDSALFFLRSALKKMKKSLGNDHKDLGALLSRLGTCHHRNKSYDSAAFYQSKTLEIWGQYYSDLSAQMALLYNSLGIASSEMGRYDKAIENYKKSLRAVEHIYGKDHPYAAMLSNNIANVFWYQGDSKLALEYFEKGLNIFYEKFENGHEKIAGFYGNIGAMYGSTDNFELALKYFLKSLNMYIDLMGDDHPNLIQKYIRTAVAYSELGQYEKAKEYFSKGYTAIKKHHNGSHIDLADYFRKMAQLHLKTNQFDLSENSLKNSIKMYKVLLGHRHPTVAYTLGELGSSYLQKKDYSNALKYYQQSLVANHATFSDTTSVGKNPSLGNSLNQNYLLRNLYNKAVVLEKIYQEEKNVNTAILSFNTLQLCDSLVDILRINNRNYQDQLTLSKTAFSVYGTAISISLALYDHTGKQNYLKRAFYFAEKNKSRVLSKSINNVSAKRMGILPDSLIDIEQNIKIDQTYYESQLVKQRTQKEGYDTIKFRYNKGRLFQLNRQHDSLVEAFEKNYPRYHQLKYKNNMVSIDELQRKIPQRTAIIEYFEGDSSLYVITITNKDFKITSIKNVIRILENIDQFREVTNLWRESEQTNESYLKYVSSAQYLYQSLVKKSIEQLLKKEAIENLIIIPDGKLSYIPFELLIAESPSAPIIGAYGSLNYLLKDYTISYAYSASLLYQDKYDFSRKSSKNAYLGYAPSYPDIEAGPSQILALGKFRDAMTSLEWNQNEVAAASTYMQGDKRLALNATETSFKQEVGNYNILHLAMHALIDDEDPMLSKLVFAQDEMDTLNDGFLHTYELFNMEMSPELVVLSACNTGYGKLEKGEGINSLAYAFAYAGCPSIVMSQWQVDDKSTSELMTHFYKNISGGMDKSSALRKAKLEFLKDPSSPYANPSYWGGFVLIGETKSIEFKGNFYIWTMVLTLLVVLLMALLYLKHLKNKG